MQHGDSLQQSLLSAARRWEADRASEASQLRQRCNAASARADAETQKLKAERAKSAELELKLREMTKTKIEESARADTLQEQCTHHRLQTLGCFLLMSELQLCLKRMKSAPAAAAASGESTDAKKIKEVADGGDTENADAAVAAAVDEQEASADDNGNGGDAARGAGASDTASTSGEEQEQGTTVAVGASAAGGQLLVPADAYDAVQALMSDMPAALSRTDLISACTDGKGRVVEGFLSQFTLSEAMEEAAQEALVEGLEACVVANRGAILKTLLDGGADAHRTAALHLAIRHGHVPIVSHLVSKVGMSVNTVDADGSSPLHIAAIANQPKAAQFLLKNSASIDATDAEGRTALEIAVSNATPPTPQRALPMLGMRSTRHHPPLERPSAPSCARPRVCACRRRSGGRRCSACSPTRRPFFGTAHRGRQGCTSKGSMSSRATRTRPPSTTWGR